MHGKDVAALRKSFEERLNRGSAKIHEDLDRFFEAEAQKRKVEFAASRIINVSFRQLEKSDKDAFCLTLSKDYSYDQVVERIANIIGLDDPTRIQLTTHCTASHKPESKPIEYRAVSRLEHMFHWLCERDYVLYYEVVEILLPEMKKVKSLEVVFHGFDNEVSVHSIQLWKDYSASYFLNKLKSQVKLSSENAELRLIDVTYGFFYEIYKPDDLINPKNYQSNLPCTLHAEEVPIEEKTGSYDCVVPVLHFTSSSRDKTGDTLKVIKNRARKLLGVDIQEVEGWKFEYLSASRNVSLKDTDILSNFFRKNMTKALKQEFLAWEQSEFTLKIMYASRENKKVKIKKPADEHQKKINKPAVCTTAPNGKRKACDNRPLDENRKKIMKPAFHMTAPEDPADSEDEAEPVAAGPVEAEPLPPVVETEKVPVQPKAVETEKREPKPRRRYTSEEKGKGLLQVEDSEGPQVQSPGMDLE